MFFSNLVHFDRFAKPAINRYLLSYSHISTFPHYFSCHAGSMVVLHRRPCLRDLWKASRMLNRKPGDWKKNSWLTTFIVNKDVPCVDILSLPVAFYIDLPGSSFYYTWNKYYCCARNSKPLSFSHVFSFKINVSDLIGYVSGLPFDPSCPSAG